MRVRGEEVGASHDVLTELGRFRDRHGLGDRPSFELDCVSVGRQPCVDVGEGRAKRRNVHVRHRELERRVVRVEFVPAGERLYCCCHR